MIAFKSTFCLARVKWVFEMKLFQAISVFFFPLLCGARYKITLAYSLTIFYPPGMLIHHSSQFKGLIENLQPLRA